MTNPTPNPTSAELASDTSLFPIWDSSVPFPSPQEMPDLDVVTHVAVERAQPDGWHYLHEAAVMWHRDRFYICWANHRELEGNDNDNLIIRGRTSFDGIHWNEPEIWVEPPLLGASSFNHPCLFSHGGKLYGFFVAWYKGSELPTTEIFILNEENGKWEHCQGCGLFGFLPFCTPQRMSDGNWILGGEYSWYDSAVAISRGDDLTHWDVVKITPPHKGLTYFPESAVIIDGDRIINFCRPDRTNATVFTAPVSESRDCGRTWSPIQLSNFPIDEGQPFAGKLSTGQNFLITTNLDDSRALLSIAVTGYEGGLFKRIFKVRHQKWPARRLFGGFSADSWTGLKGTWVGKPTEWSYPNAWEHNGNLYIAYTQGKEDCALSIIPIEVLAV